MTKIEEAKFKTLYEKIIESNEETKKFVDAMHRKVLDEVGILSKEINILNNNHLLMLLEWENNDKIGKIGIPSTVQDHSKRLMELENKDKIKTWKIGVVMALTGFVGTILGFLGNKVYDIIRLLFER